jgi:phosphodiesterase/alkaline phosphatase D-like protein
MGPKIKLACRAVILAIVLAAFAAAQTQTPAPNADRPAPVQITNGPVVENVTDTTAIIAWSTNVNAGTSLRYGTDPEHLDKAAGMPWGGFTHRVYLKNLQPGTKYFFQAESGKAQGTGTTATSVVMSFETKSAADATSQLDDNSDHECSPQA